MRLYDNMRLHYTKLPANSVVCLMAPTASGKTDLAFRLCDTGVFEIVSVDSALIYQDMNIGTAKPTPDELLRYPHALVDIILPTQSYDVAQFVADCDACIQAIHQKGKIPLLVGGTMMYYMALIQGLSDIPKTTPDTRQKVATFWQQHGNAGVFAYLQQHDPVICQKLQVSDTQRLLRAMEVHVQTGIALSVHQNTPKAALSHNRHQKWLGLCVLPARDWLHNRIQLRLQAMWQAGFVEEVIAIIQKYPELTPDLPAMRCVGYRQVLEYLIYNHHIAIKQHPNLSQYIKNYKNNTKTRQDISTITCQDMKNKALYATRQLAKRQNTWLRQLVALGLSAQRTTQNTQITTTVFAFDSIQQVERQLLGL